MTEFSRLGFLKRKYHYMLKIITVGTGCYLVQTAVDKELCFME